MLGLALSVCGGGRLPHSLSCEAAAFRVMGHPGRWTVGAGGLGGVAGPLPK